MNEEENFTWKDVDVTKTLIVGILSTNVPTDCLTPDSAEAALSARGMGGAGPARDHLSGQAMHGDCGRGTASSADRPRGHPRNRHHQPTRDHCPLGQNHRQTFLQRDR